MRLRRPLAAAAGALGGVVVAHSFLQRRAGELEPPLPGEERSYRWRGMDVAYTEAGDPQDPDLLLVHGINAAATSYEWKPVFDALASEYHVVAPDLPGFGRSDRPPVDYDADLYVDFVRDFADDVAPDAACVASSLSGAYAILAQREAGVFSRLVLICPTARTTLRRNGLGRLLRTPIVGAAAFDALASKASIRYFSAAHSFYSPTAIDRTAVDYQWRTAHQAGARYAPAAFVSGRLDPDDDVGVALAAIDAPVTLVWGREADFPPLEPSADLDDPPLSSGRDLAEIGDARLVVFDRAKLLPHVEHPEQFVDTVRASLPRAEA